MDQHRVIIGPSFPFLLERMVEEILVFREIHPLEPELIAVPSSSLARFLESYIAGVSKLPLLNVQIVPLRLVPNRLAGADVLLPKAAHRLILRFAARAVLRDRSKEKRRVRALAALDAADVSLFSTFGELLDAGLFDADLIDSYLETSDTVSEPGRTTLRLYADWLNFLSIKNIMPEQMIAADLTFSLSVSRMHIYGFHELSGVSRELVERLIRATPDLGVVEYYPCHPEARKGRRFGYEFAVKQVDERMGARVIEEIREESGELTPFSTVDGRLVLSAPKGGDAGEPESNPNVRFLAVPGEEGEVEAAAREIIKLLSRSTYKETPNKIAVLLPDMDRYQTILRRVFREFDIPVFWLKPLSAKQHPVVSWLRSVLELPGRGFPREEFVEAFTSPLMRFASSSSGQSFHELERKLKERGIVRLKGNLWLRKMGENLEAPEWASLVYSFVEEMEALDRTQDVGAFLSSLRSFVERWVRPELLEGDSLMAQWLREIEHLAGLEDLGFEDEEGFGEILREAVLDVLNGMMLPRTDNTDKGVTVGSVRASLGMSFDVVFVLGCNRGQFPRGSSEDPLLPDTTRARLAVDLGFPVSIRSLSRAEEKLLFVLTLLSARTELFIIHRYVSSSGKPESESLLLPLIFGVLADRPEIVQMDREVRLRSAAAARPSPISAREVLRLPAVNEIDRRKKFNLLTNLVGADFCHVLDRAIHSARARIENPLPTQFDLILDAQLTRTARHPLRTVEAWSKLEKCPFQFFLNSILEIPWVQDPDILWSLGYRDAGILAHKLFEVLLSHGIPPDAATVNPVEKAWEETVEWFLKGHPEIDLPGLASYELDRLRHWLLPVVQQELKILQSQMLGPAGRMLLTPEFQPRNARLRLSRDMGQELIDIPLRIRIDRLDKKEDEGGVMKPFRMVDYKIRFSNTGWKTDMTAMQVFLYGTAIEAGSEVRPDGEYAEIVAGKDPKEVKTLLISGDDEELWSQFKKKAFLLHDMVSGNQQLFYFTSDRTSVCKWCGYARFCRKYEHSIVLKSDRNSGNQVEALKAVNINLKDLLKNSLHSRY